MFLSLREIRHAKARYTLIIVIMLLVSFLVLFVTGLAKGLAYANISAVQNMPANYFALQSDAEHAFRRSQLGAAELEAVRAVTGEKEATPLAVQMSTVTSGSKNGSTDVKTDITFFAVDMNGILAPKVAKGDPITNDTIGSVLVDQKLESSGITIGSTITDQATGLSYKVAGFVKNSSYSHTPVVYMNLHDWQAIKQGGMGATSEQATSFNVIALNITADQADQLSGKLGHVEIITQKQAISSIPGYSAEQGSLMMMIVFLFVIAAFVLAVFFYVITIQKTSQFGILKAMGTKMSYLAWSVVGQVLFLSLASLAVSLVLTFGMNMALPDSMPFQLEPMTILTTSALFVGMSLCGSLISVFRVAKVDALEAIGRAYA